MGHYGPLHHDGEDSLRLTVLAGLRRAHRDGATTDEEIAASIVTVIGFEWSLLRHNPYRTTLAWLRFADSGKANFATDIALTRLGHDGYWELEQIGTKPCEPYVAHGNFNVDRVGVFRSRLTDKGLALAAELEAEAAR